MSDEDLKKLIEPFPAADIEWRVQRAGKNGERVWAMVFAYVTNRAIQDRLDAVCGPANWRNEFVGGPVGGVLCGLSINIYGEWVTKWDGSDNTDVEAVKGGLSGAMKRAAVQWGIGRYLYRLESNWANIHEGGSRYQPADKKGSYPAFNWDPPELPKWAVQNSDGAGAEDGDGNAAQGKGKPAAPKKQEPPDPPAADRVKALKAFHAAWDEVIAEVEDGDEVDAKRNLENVFLWAQTPAKATAFNVKKDYVRPLDAETIDGLTAMLKASKADIVGWLETDNVRESVGLPKVSVETCAGCAAILSPADKEKSDMVKLPKGYCEACRPDATVAMMKKKREGTAASESTGAPA